MQADSLLSESPGKPKNTGVVSLSLLQWIFLTQELNQVPLQADSLPAELPGKPPGFAGPPLIMKRDSFHRSGLQVQQNDSLVGEVFMLWYTL